MPGRILIADDVPTNRIALKARLEAAHYEVLQAESASETLNRTENDEPDLVMLSVSLPDMSGVALCRALKSRPGGWSLPVLVLTAEADPRTKLEALRAGADDFLCRPLDGISLLARVRNLLRARATAEELRLREATALELGFAEAPAGFEAPGRVAMVTTRTARAMTLRAELRSLLPDRVAILQPDDVLGAAGRRAPPDVYLVDANLHRPADGLTLLAELRSRAESRHAAIVIRHSEEDVESAAMALDLGANDLISDTADIEEMAVRLRGQLARKKAADRLRSAVPDSLKLAMTDALTGLYNRRYALPHLERMAAREAAAGRRFAVMVIDLDRFKTINDRFGHPAGDAVLREVAQRLRNDLRDPDLIARIGGEEFLVAIPDTSLETARSAAERLCRAARSRPISIGKGVSVEVTLSIGVAMGGGFGPREPVAQLIDRADRALYDAKTSGRDQVTVSRLSAA